MITWQDGRNGRNIYAQRFSSDGTALGINFKVNDDQGSASQRNPSICTDASGNFVITWEDARSGYLADIYAQRYSRDGSVLGTNFKVNDDQGSVWQEFPAISTDGSGNFVITWLDDRNGNNIYAQRYSSDGSVLGTNFKVNDGQGRAQSYSSLSISIDGSGNFGITWSDWRNGDYDIYVQRYSKAGTTLGANFKVNDDQGSAEQSFPSISIDGSGNFVITWQDYRNGDADIYTQRYSSNNGIALGINFKVNDDQRSADQSVPSISIDGSGNFVITWQDDRNGRYYSDIYAQRYSSDGAALGANFKVNDDQESAAQRDPSISTDGSGNFVITWEDYRNEIGDIYAQRYTSDGSKLGANFKVNDDQRSLHWFPCIFVDDTGNFGIVWQDFRDGYSDIYAQRYSSDGTALGPNFKVNDNQEIVRQKFPSISSDGSGNFVITWQDYRNIYTDIYAQRYSSDGTAKGANFKVNDDQGSRSQWYPSISTDGSGNFVITWQDYLNGNNIYAQRYSSDGSALGINFKVNDDQGSAYQDYPSISAEGSGNFVITWLDDRNGGFDIYAQRYSSAGTKMGDNFRVTNTSKKNQYFPDVSLWNNRIYTTWEDSRIGGTGFDIWANVLDWDNPENKDLPPVPTAFILSQNYPNPFNSSTKISYSIPKPGFVILKIYDILGREIKSIVNEFQNAANYSINFNASALSSGIYFYRIRAGEFMDTKKFILQR